MADLRPLRDYATVQTWFDGLRQHWGGDPEHDDPERLDILEAFCRYAGTDPDTIIGQCVLLKNGEKRIRAKGRKRYADLIDAFQAQTEGSRTRRTKCGNTVRSFLIHNGILLQSGVQRGEG